MCHQLSTWTEIVIKSENKKIKLLICYKLIGGILAYKHTHNENIVKIKNKKILIIHKFTFTSIIKCHTIK